MNLLVTTAIGKSQFNGNKRNMINIVLIQTEGSIQHDFIGVKDHYNTLSDDIHTLELIMN